MNQRAIALRNTFTVLFFLAFLVAMLGGLFSFNLTYTRGSEISLEFLPIWKAANNLLLEGLSPYGEFTTYEIQRAVYGRVAGPGELPLRVGMPMPLLLIFLPLGAFVDMEVARAVWMVVLQISMILWLVICVRLMDWKLHWFQAFLLFLFGFFWAYTIESLLSASFAIVLAMFLFGALLALRASLDELSGMLLAFSFFNLEMGGLLLLFLLVWTALKGRWRVWAGLLMSLTILGFIAFIVDSGWMLSFFFTVIRNWNANQDPSTFTLFTGWFPGLGRQIAWGLTFLLLLLLMFEAHQALLRRNTLQFFWVASLVAAVTPLAGLPVKDAGLVFLLPAFLLAASVLSQRWAVVGSLAALFVLIFALASSWLLLRYQVESGFLWMSILAFLTLYWVRWWVVRPARLWADQITATGGKRYVPF
jgi:hypothetical protein